MALLGVKSRNPSPLKEHRVPLGVWIAGLLAVLSLAGCGQNLDDLFGLGIGEEVPPEVEIDGSVTVTYGTGNGGGGSTEFPQPADGGKIKLPGPDGFTPPATGFEMAFAGWHDGTLTYEAGYEYTVTGNVTLEARWGFTTKEGVAWYLGTSNAHFKDKDGNILLVVCDGAIPLAWTDLSGITVNNVELDLSASKLGVDSSKKFDLAKAKASAVLILPRAATKVKNTYSGTALHEVSGLNVTSIEDYAFEDCASLATADFPKATSIGTYAFANCANLKTADFPSVRTISIEAFSNCPLKTITIGALTGDLLHPISRTGIHDSFADIYSVAGTYKFDGSKWSLESAAKTEEPAS
jgi:hypothetical protein